MGQVVLGGLLGLKPGFNGFVLLIEVGEIGDQILHNEHVWERVDDSGVGVLVDVAETGEGVGAVDVHRTGATNTLTTGASEGESGVLLVLDLDQSIQNHRATLVEIDRI